VCQERSFAIMATCHESVMSDAPSDAPKFCVAPETCSPCEDEIVASIAREVIGGLVATIDAACEESPRPEVADLVRRLIVKVNAMADNEGRLALVVWGEAQSSEAVAQFAAQEVSLVRDRIVEYLRLTRGAAPGTSEEDVEMASVVVSLLTGFLVQRRIIGPLDVDRYASTATRLLVDPARIPLK
jgi:hypothetical protein